MFTGIVETMGNLVAMETAPKGRRLRIEPHNPLPGLAVGDSICVNGICLTIERLMRRKFEVQAGAMTLIKTTIEKWKPGQLLNLERAMPANGTVGGHFVQGHINCVGVVMGTSSKDEQTLMSFLLPEPIMKYVAYDGSITVDGVSLTVIYLQPDIVGVNLIPYTLKHTTLGKLNSGDKINVETDIIGRHVERMIWDVYLSQGKKQNEAV